MGRDLMKRICMITQSAYPNDPRVRKEAEALEEAGYEIDIICIPTASGQPKVEQFNKVTAYRIYRDRRDDNILSYIVKTSIFFLLAFIKLQPLYWKRKYQVIQVHNMPDHHIFIAFIQKMLGVKLILDIHDLTPELFSSKWSGRKAALLKSAVSFFEKLSTGISDHVLTVADTCKEILVARGVPESKVTLILNTPNRNIFKFNDEREFSVIKENFKMIYHGTIAERFGLHIAVEAMPLLLQKIPSSKLYIYGKYDPAYRVRLEAMIKDLNLEENVILKGRRSLEVIYDLINECDAGIVPYLDNEYMNLALSTKTFEYAAAGLPIISTRLQSLAMTFDDDSLFFVQPDNPEAIALAAIKLCGDPELRKSLTINANNRLNSISWEVMSNRLINLMDNLSSNGKTHRTNKIEEKQTQEV
jgi:glycosyltransferase involved in cell wall biosynthesis